MRKHIYKTRYSSSLCLLPVFPSAVLLNRLVNLTSTIVTINFCTDVCHYKLTCFIVHLISFHIQLKKVALCKTIRSINEGPFKSDSKGPGCLSGGGGFCCNCNTFVVKCLKDTTKFASFAFCRCFLITRIKEAISFLMMIG